MNTKFLIFLYLVLMAVVTVYLPEYGGTILKYQDSLNQLMKNSSTALITKGS